MMLLQFLLMLITSYLGLLAGFFLNRIAKEEMHDGKKYIYELQRVIFFVLLVILLIWANLSWMWIAIICIALAIASQFLDIFRKQNVNSAIYGLFGIAIALLQDTKYLQLFAGLVFLSGVSAGSFLTNSKKDWKSILRNNLLYFAAGIITYFLS